MFVTVNENRRLAPTVFVVRGIQLTRLVLSSMT